MLTINVKMIQATQTRRITNLLLKAILLFAVVSIVAQLTWLWSTYAEQWSSTPPPIADYPRVNAIEKVKGYVSNLASDTEALRVTFTTSDPPEQIIQFYKEALDGWGFEESNRDGVSSLVVRSLSNGSTGCLEIRAESIATTSTRVEIRSFAGTCQIGQFYLRK
jgi:hypothetical protein